MTSAIHSFRVSTECDARNVGQPQSQDCVDVAGLTLNRVPNILVILFFGLWQQLTAVIAPCVECHGCVYGRFSFTVVFCRV